MSTVLQTASTESPPDTIGPAPGDRSHSGWAAVREEAEDRVLFHDVPWSLLEAIDEAKGDRSEPRITYLDGELELMSPSHWHEVLTCRFGSFIGSLVRGLNVRYLPAGASTWKGPAAKRAKEADCCFYLENEARVRGRRKLDLRTDPPPDLAIEIQLSRPRLDVLEVYAGLGVPEVWTYDGVEARFWALASGSYHQVEMSRAIPTLRPADVSEWIDRADELGDTDWSRAVEAWARDELARRTAST